LQKYRTWLVHVSMAATVLLYMLGGAQLFMWCVVVSCA